MSGLLRTATVPPAVRVLEPFVAAGLFGPSEVHLAATVARLCPGVAPEVLLGLAVAARGPRLGHVCIALQDVHRLIVDDDDPDGADDLPWPDLGTWVAALADSSAVADPANAEIEPLCPLVWDGRRLYLQRYFRYEVSAAQDLVERAGGTSVPPTGFDTALDGLFGPDTGAEPDLQRRAAEVALTHGLSVIAGGPGTGKTRTIARLLAVAQRLAAEEGRQLDVALAAPTGKAAARMTEAVRSEVDQAEADGSVSTDVAELIRRTEATTIHSLLGWAPGTRFRHDRHDPLPHDLVVVDETSMVSLPLMSRLLGAIRPDSSLVLVGDPFQLASVEAGTVMADLVGPGDVAANATHPFAPHGAEEPPLAGRLTVLRRVRRFAVDSAIAALAEAVRSGDADRALDILDGPDPDATWVRDTDHPARAALEGSVCDAAVDVVTAALAGQIADALAAATRIKVLAATRHHPLGLYDWSDRIEDEVRRRVPELPRTRRWYVGRPIIVTANDRVTKVSNGDVGLVVRQADGFAVAMAAGDGVRLVPTSRLDQVETWWAMTIHKSQGSEFPRAVVSLPAAGSPILSRELLYTGVTRAREQVTIVAGEAALRLAIASPISRASGLGDRLWGPGTR